MRCNANVMGKLFLTVMLVFAVWVNSVKSAEIELSVATDQPSYWPNEVITVSVTAYNPNDYEVTFDFPSSHQASYIVDDVYDWSSDKAFFAAFTQVTIGPGSSHSWDFNHDWEYTYGSSTYGYDLSIGTHSVVGALQPTGWSPDAGRYTYAYYSPAVEFEVAYALGDFDKDGDVDGADFGLWQAGYPTASGATMGTGDADGDGDVDGIDFGLWQTNYPTAAPAPVAGGAAVPEPATLGLLIVGGVVLLNRRFK